MKLDSTGNQVSQKVLDIGNRSCGISDLKNDRWLPTPFKITKRKKGKYRGEYLTYHYMKFKETGEVEKPKTVEYVETSTNTKKPFWNESGVKMCWYPELGWVKGLDSSGNPVNTGEYRDCNWRKRGYEDAGVRYKDSRWLSSFQEKKTTGCTWKCVIEPCDDDMLPEGCRWEDR